jgi:hypothetical protein
MGGKKLHCFTIDHVLPPLMMINKGKPSQNAGESGCFWCFLGGVLFQNDRNIPEELHPHCLGSFGRDSK